MALQPKDIALKIKKLASLPDVCVKINELADDPNSSLQDLTNVIGMDPAMAAKLLKIANSPFYGFANRIDDLNRAIMLIGTQGLRDLLWATSSIESFSNLSNKFVSMETFWKHSLYTATVARVLANKCHVLNKDRLFLSGLLHDLGHLALYQVMPDEMEVIFMRAKNENENLCVAEKSILGFSHATVTYAILKMWRLPDSICKAVAYHHLPGRAEDHKLDAAIIHIADVISHKAGWQGSAFEHHNHFDQDAWLITNLSSKIVDSVIQIAEDQFAEAEEIYLAPLKMAPAA